MVWPTRPVSSGIRIFLQGLERQRHTFPDRIGVENLGADLLTDRNDVGGVVDGSP
jgi:hypothetical protein